MNKETLRMQMLAGVITESQYKAKLNEVLNNDDLMYDRMVDMDQEQLVSNILSFAENNPKVKLVDYLNEEFGYGDEDEIEESQYKRRLNEVLNNDDLMYDRMVDADQELLVSNMLSFAENNPKVKLVDYLNEEWGYDEEE